MRCVPVLSVSLLAELPPIPASFDTPTDDTPEGDAPLAASEGTP
ncbi:hypothetical protein [Alcaligenes faecalis]|nr:hypothetical protein [Alcaligenes faecalis]